MKIIFEDNHILVVEKPVNMPACPDASKDLDLLTALKNYLKEKYHKPGNVYLGLVHRLDRPVAGVMVFAKTSKAASRLSDSLRKNLFKKTYLAVVCGIAEKKGHLEDYLLKDFKNNIVRTADKDQGRLAILDYCLLKNKDNLSLIKINLKTGRSHQIRVQMANAGLPLWGDQKYNPGSQKGQQIALYGQQLSFPHPITKETISFTCYPTSGKIWSYFD
ncbi:MAG: RluA family pseudouridine synthase [Erysipelotrichaceae bacterium]|jgi:23S rRNA pseudouridine1911/1915/1917 synthase